MKKLFLFLFLFSSHFIFSQGKWEKKFEQLGTLLPTPNNYRGASGAPGKDYWQQRADYDMKIFLDDENQKLIGSEKITYYNNSPDNLSYLWVQLDQNVRANESETPLITTNRMSYALDGKRLQSITNNYSNADGGKFKGGFKINSVLGEKNNPLQYTIIKTMMRIELENILRPGEKFVFNIDWSYNINDRMSVGGRGGYEYFPEDKELFDKFRHELYAFTTRLFNYYQDLKVRKNIRFLEIDYEFRPLINELHAMYTSTNRQITKNVVINYLHNLNSARILFVLNYSKKNSSNTNETATATATANGNTNQEHIVSSTEFPLLKA